MQQAQMERKGPRRRSTPGPQTWSQLWCIPPDGASVYFPFSASAAGVFSQKAGAVVASSPVPPCLLFLLCSLSSTATARHDNQTLRLPGSSPTYSPLGRLLLADVSPAVCFSSIFLSSISPLRLPLLAQTSSTRIGGRDPLCTRPPLPSYDVLQLQRPPATPLWRLR